MMGSRSQWYNTARLCQWLILENVVGSAINVSEVYLPSQMACCRVNGKGVAPRRAGIRSLFYIAAYRPNDLQDF